MANIRTCLKINSLLIFPNKTYYDSSIKISFHTYKHGLDLCVTIVCCKCIRKQPPCINSNTKETLPFIVKLYQTQKFLRSWKELPLKLLCRFCTSGFVSEGDLIILKDCWTEFRAIVYWLVMFQFLLAEYLSWDYLFIYLFQLYNMHCQGCKKHFSPMT